MAEYDLDLIDVLEAAPVGAIILSDFDHQVLFWNTSVLSILGNLQGSAFARAACHGFFYDGNEFAAARDRLAAGQEVRHLETRLWREDGREMWATVSMRTIRFEHNAATLIWYFDITEAKLRERQLERSQDALLAVLDTAPTGAALTDGPERISYWNSALLDIVPGGDADSAETIRDCLRRVHTSIVANGQGATACLPMQDGSERFVEGWTFALEFEGAPSELTWLHDVTKVRQAEQSAKAATAAKSAFLATMSHEIRTPMNGVMAIAELLRETRLDEDQARMVSVIQQSGDSLIRVTNDILDFSKLEANQLQIENIPFHLDEVVDDVIALLAPKAAEKALDLGRVGRGIGDCVRTGDPLRLRQVLLNLVGNAIKFTSVGSVTIDVEACGETVAVRVIDTGVGIAADRIERIFTPYQQSDASVARNYGGTGLGLSISNALIGLMNGTLTVTSTPGRGSCFAVTLELPEDMTAPLRSAQKRAVTRAQFWAASDRTQAEANHAVILCAEDNPTNRDVLDRVLNRLGFAYDMVNDGEEALLHLDRSRHGLLLTDGHMPNLGGWELAHRIRVQERQEGLPRLPVIVVTADVVSRSASEQDADDVDGYLTKPLRRDQVEEAVLAVLPVWSKLRVAADRAAEPKAVAVTALDLSGLIDLVGSDQADLECVLQDFVQGTMALREKLAAAFAAGDRAAIVAAAHALKGSAGYAGAAAIRDKAADLEANAKQGAELEGLRATFEALCGLVMGLPRDVEASLAALG